MGNCLVLGGNGFIGSHLIDKLLLEGHKVKVYDKYKEYFRAPLAGVDYIYGDFGNRGLLEEALSDIDIVFHLISTTHPKTSNDDPIFDVQSNVLETLFLLEKCVKKNIKKVVYISSGGAVYGKPEKLPVKETYNTTPLCSYGISKLTIEKYLELFKYLYNLNYVIIRPSNPYGPRQNPNGIQGAISVFLGRIAQNREIEIWGDGNVIRDYIFVTDLVDGIYRAAIAETVNNVFNLGVGYGYSINQIILKLKEIIDKNIKVVYRGKRAFDVQEIYLDVSLAKNHFNWSPLVTLDEGINKTWDFIKHLENRE